jgi:uncharacterized protein (TIGR02145 family)
MLAAQTILKDRYIIESKIGQGGFGITYLATDSSLGIKVCIKELFIAGNNTRGENNTVKSEEIGSFSFQSHKDRFLREARKLAQFDHPNIVRITEVFEANHTAYMVMKYVEGENMRELVKREGALSEEKVLIIAHQLLSAVEEVHKNGLLHRDIAPDNLIWSKDQKLVLIDFGSIKDFAADETQSLTQTTILKHGYAPIEQYSSTNQLGTFSDIYAIAASLYFLLTATKPLAATDRNFQTLAELKSLKPKLSEKLSNAIMKALSLKPADRFQKVEEFREVLLNEPKNIKNSKNIPQKQKLETLIKPIEEKKTSGKIDFFHPYFLKRGLIFLLVILILIGIPNIQYDKNYLLLSISAFILLFHIISKSFFRSILIKYNLIKINFFVQSIISTFTVLSIVFIIIMTWSDFKNQQNRKKEAEISAKVEEIKQKEEQEIVKNGVTDIDGNKYKIVKIGNQVWMAENLITTRYSNGDKILHLTDSSDWENNINGAWCWYDNNSKYNNIYGKLYNWYAVDDYRNLCPVGWHIPSDNEWEVLVDYLGGKEISGHKMKSQSGWKYNGNGNNESGFSGHPGGDRYFNGSFYSIIGHYGGWWSSTEDDTVNAWIRTLYYFDSNVYRSSYNKGKGYSVRCLRD